MVEKHIEVAATQMMDDLVTEGRETGENFSILILGDYWGRSIQSPHFTRRPLWLEGTSEFAVLHFKTLYKSVSCYQIVTP